MLTAAFLIAGVFSFFVAATVALWRLVIQNRNLSELPAWEPLLGIVNAGLAMIFFSLGIYRSLQGPTSNGDDRPTPTIQMTGTPPASGPTVIIVPFPTPVPGATAAPTAAVERPVATQAALVAPSVTLTSPADGATVARTARVVGDSQGVAPGQVPDMAAPWLYILVRRTDTASGPTWWVQAHPVVDPGGSWDGFLSEGVGDMEPGTAFDVCAIITNELLPVGEHVETPRAFSRDCVTVEAA